MRLALEEWLAKGAVVTEAHVAGAVRARIGAILDKRRERIRATQLTTERVELAGEPPIVEGATPSLGGNPGSGSGVKQTQTAPRPSGPDWAPPSSRVPPRATMPSVPPPSGPPRSAPQEPPPPSYQPVLDARIVEAPVPPPPAAPPAPEAAAYATIGALLAAIAIVALGAIGYFLWRASSPATPAPPPARSAPVATSASPPAPVPVDTSITVEVLEPVMFHVSPDAAILIVDGVQQAPGVRAVTRRPGMAVNVIVRASGFEDATVTIDDAFANKSAIVTLRPLKHRSGDSPKRNDPLPANPY
jgi:hypothetical protein